MTTSYISDLTDLSSILVKSTNNTTNGGFNQDISSWDTSNLTDMNYLFALTDSNQDLSGWCVSNITSQPDNFDVDATNWVLDRPVWGTYT